MFSPIANFRFGAITPVQRASSFFAGARGGGGHGHGSSYCSSCARDSHGRIARSPEARQEFMTQTGYPHGRPGYVVDHIIPLKRGGADEPWNMQWQTIAEGKAKDATE